MKPRSRLALLATPLTLALTLALSVGASAQVASLVDPDESPGPGTAEATLQFEDRDEAILAYAQCMRDNGIKMDDPQAGQGRARGIFGGGPGGQTDDLDRRSDEFITARASCSYILEASRPEIDPAAEQERLEEQLALARCIRENGYEQYPDPAIGSDGRLERTRRQGFDDLGIDRRSTAFQSVISACRDEVGLEGGPGLGGGADIRGN